MKHEVIGKYLLIILVLFPIVSQSQIITTIAGTGSSVFSGDHGPATAAGIPNPAFGQFDKYGNYYFADPPANRISRIDTAGIINTVAGNGMAGFAGDNTAATSARLNGPEDVKLDAAGNLYIADIQNYRIRKVDAATGIITTIAGTGTPSYCCDGGPATTADLWGIQGICLDKYSNLYISDAFNYRIRKVTPLGMISTFAGTGTPGYSGENTLADTSKVGVLAGLCSDTSGNIYVADNSNSRVLKINTSGIMSTFAGNGIIPYGGDGIPATAASINMIDVALDSFNNLFIADRYNNRVYKVDAVSGILYNVAGNGVASDVGDGSPATAASLNVPVAVTLDACGNLYIPTIGSISMVGSGRRIRKVTFNPFCDPYSHFDSATLDLRTIIPEEFNIYPNPAYNELTITTPNKINSITITNLIGQVLYNSQTSPDISQGKKKVEINISTLLFGIYLIKVTDDKGFQTIKKIIKH